MITIRLNLNCSDVITHVEALTNQGYRIVGIEDNTTIILIKTYHNTGIDLV